MASNGDLPRWLDRVHPTRRVPHRAELAVAVAVLAVVATVDVRGAIGFSSFAVLLYYGVANAAALTLGPADRRWPRALAAVGIVGCAALACSLPLRSVVGGLAVLAVGGAVWLVRRSRNGAGRAPTP
jgi:APA family basic amino acid/polyamine antiporter